MKSISKKARIWVALLSFLSAGNALALEQKSLGLTVEGTIANAPEWRNDLNAPIANTSFSFSNNIAGSPIRNIDSSEAKIKLFNAKAYPATVAISMPNNCSIGDTNLIQDAHVHFLNNGSAITTTGSTFTMAEGLQTFKIRFASAGGYGDKSGAIKCDAGALVYEY